MPRQPETRRLKHDFDSSRVDRAWFYPDTETIEVEFPDGMRWVYRFCREREWKEFIKAPSAGRYLRTVLDKKPNRAK